MSDDFWEKVNKQTRDDIITMVMDIVHGRISVNELADRINDRQIAVRKLAENSNKKTIDTLRKEDEQLKKEVAEKESQLECARDVTHSMAELIVEHEGCESVPHHAECFTDCLSVHGEPKQRTCVKAHFINQAKETDK